jgi:precorrin-6A/cobalt-precorrin-6A reductase
MAPTLLILGGTSDAYDLAQALADRPGLRVISSLAGRTTAPRRPAGQLRSGGFGGALGLAAYMKDNHIDAVVDATHPFASRMGWNAAQGCAMAGVPLLRLERPAWVAGPGDRWDEVDDWDQAVALVAARSRRVLLAVGRQEDLAPFAGLDQVWFLIRSVEAPAPMPPFAQAELLLARGPFAHDDERRLLASRNIDTILCKNSGGPTDAKLAAARELGIKVVMKRRPPRPDLPLAADVAQTLNWLGQAVFARQEAR